MDSKHLTDYLHRMIEPDTCQVIGVVPRDLLGEQIVVRFPACAIVNTDPASLPGQHWVAFYFNSANDYEFFDSYAMLPKVYGFDRMFQKPKTCTVHSFQPDLATSCGQFCLYYLQKKSLKFPMDSIVNSFSKFDLNWNDKLVRKFVHQFTNLPRFIHPHYLPPIRSQISIKKCQFNYT